MNSIVRALLSLSILALAACQDASDSSDGSTSTSSFSDTSTPSVSARDGIIDGVKEVCDDGNRVNRDGCSAAGAIETGFSCTGEPSVCGRIVYVGDNSGADTYRCVGTADHVALNSALQFVHDTTGYVGVRIRIGVTCAISDSVSIYNDTALEGEPGAKIRLVNAAGWPQFKAMIQQAQSPARNISIRGLEIDGNRANQTEPSGNSYYTAIKMEHITGFTAHDLNIHHNLNDAILVNPGSKLHFFRNRCHTIGHDCYYLIQASDIRIHDDPLLSTGTNSGVRLVETRNAKVYRENISGIAGACFQIQGWGGNIEIFENTCKDAVQGVWAFSYGSHTAAELSLHLHHNVFASSRGSGNRVLGLNVIGYHAVVEHNVIWGINGTGISSASLYSQAPGGSGYDVDIRNNIIGNNAGYGVDNQYPATHNFRSSNNCFYQNTSGNYAGLSAGTGDQNVDPRFVNPPADFHLQPGSNCAHAGAY